MPPDQVGQASGISNMARYVGGSLAVAATATVYATAIANHRAAGSDAADALAAGVARSALLMAIMAASGVVLAALIHAYRSRHPTTADRVAAATAALHTIPSPAGDA